MAVINTGSFAKALRPGVRKWYGKQYAEHPVEYTDIYETIKSNKAWEEDVGISSFALADVIPEGSPVNYYSEQQGFLTRYVHVTYGMGFIITRNMIEDNLYKEVAERNAKGLAFSMRQTKENVAANVLNRAFNSSFVGGDGKELCATDHPNVAGGTFANELATAADLSEAALEQACTDLMKMKNDAGLRISVMPKKLIVSPDLFWEAHRILGSEYRPGTADNDINVLYSTGKFPGGVKVNHYLTDTDAWFIITNIPHGMIHFERRADDFDMEPDFSTDNIRFKATARYSFGWTDPRGVFGSPGA